LYFSTWYYTYGLTPPTNTASKIKEETDKYLFNNNITQNQFNDVKQKMLNATSKIL